MLIAMRRGLVFGFFASVSFGLAAAACGGFSSSAEPSPDASPVDDGAAGDSTASTDADLVSDSATDAAAPPFSCEGFTLLCANFESMDAGAWPAPFEEFYVDHDAGTGEIISDVSAPSPSHSLHLHSDGTVSNVFVRTFRYSGLKSKTSFQVKLPTLAQRTRIATVQLPTDNFTQYVRVNVDVTSLGEVILGYAPTFLPTPAESRSGQNVVHENEWTHFVLEVDGTGSSPTARLTSPVSATYTAPSALLNPVSVTDVLFATSILQNPSSDAGVTPRDVYFDNIRIEPLK